VSAVRGGDLDHRRRAGGRNRHLQFLRDPAGLDRRADHEPADPLVLYRDVLLLPDLPPVRLPGDPDLPATDPLQRLGRRPRAHGHVRRLRHVATGNDDLSDPPVAEDSLVQPAAPGMALLAFLHRHRPDVGRPHHPGSLSRPFLVVAASLGALPGYLDPVLGGPSRRRATHDRGLSRVRRQHRANLLDLEASAPGSGRRNRVIGADLTLETGFFATRTWNPCWNRKRESCSLPASASSPWRFCRTRWCRP